MPVNCVVTSVNGFAGPVTFSCPNLAPDLTCDIEPSHASLAGGGSAKFRILLFSRHSSAGPLADPQNIQVRAASGKISVTVTTEAGGMWMDADHMSLPSFDVSCDAASVTLAEGIPKQVACQVQSIKGFGGPIHLSCEIPPAGIQCTPNPNLLPLPPGGTVRFSLSLVAARGSNSAGLIQVRGTTDDRPLPRLSDWIHVQVFPAVFHISCQQGTAPYNPANGEACVITPWEPDVDLGNSTWTCTVENAPAAQCFFKPQTVYLRANTSGSNTVFIEAPPGTYTFDVTGTSSAYTDHEQFSLTIPAPASPTPSPTSTPSPPPSPPGTPLLPA